MSLTRIAIAGRYAERRAIKQILADAKLDDLPVEITASWLDATAEGDGDLSDEQAVEQATQNCQEIIWADILLYFPSWALVPGYSIQDSEDIMTWEPRWSPGRLIDFGIALAYGLELIIVGTPEPSIYFRGVTVCTPETLHETVKKVVER